MSKNVRKILEVVFFILILALSVLIFVNRERITNVSNISYLGLLGLCFLANSTVLLPAPSLVIAASCATVMNPWLVAVFAAVGSSLGEFVGYAFGSVSKDISPRFKRILDALLSKIKNGYFMVFLLALLPLPLFDVIGIYSGGTKMNPVIFFCLCFAGKFLKLLFYVNAFGWVINKGII